MHHYNMDEGSCSLYIEDEEFTITLRNSETGAEVSLAGPATGVYETSTEKISQEDVEWLAKRLVASLSALDVRAKNGQRRPGRSAGKLEFHQDERYNFRFRLRDRSGDVLAVSRPYPSQTACKRAAEALARTASMVGVKRSFTD